MSKRTTERLRAERPEDVARAAELLRAGGLVAFATETVYGLGAKALEAEAVAGIFWAKRRPAWDPLIVHVAERAEIEPLVRMEAGPRRRLELLAERFWPGPLTMLLPRSERVPDAVTAGRPRVGVRVPDHPVAQVLLRAAGCAVAAPSANRFGHTSPTTAEHVLEDLDGRIDAVLDGGPTRVGVESTVVDLCETPVRIYRPGAVTMEAIRTALGEAVEVFRAEPRARPESLPSPGVGIRHYAPRARLVLVADAQEVREARGGRVGCLLPDGWEAPTGAEVFPWGPWGEPEVLAERLYAGLRALDAAGVEVIVCPVPEGDGVAAAMRDRLEKAAREA